MALPKKKSKPITVDGRNFRYMVREKDNQLILTIQEEIDHPPKSVQFILSKSSFVRSIIKWHNVASIIKKHILK